MTQSNKNNEDREAQEDDLQSEEELGHDLEDGDNGGNSNHIIMKRDGKASSSNETLDPTSRTTTSTSDDNNNDGSSSMIAADSVGQVLKSPFVLIQLAINGILGFLGPLATFYLLFGFLSQGPYDWYGPQLLGVVLGSLVGSPILIFALMPVGLPEAVEKGWFPKIAKDKLQPTWLQWFIDWKWATARNIAWTLVVAIILVPISLLIARYGLGPTLTTWQLIWFNVVYEVVLAVPVVVLGLIGYSVHVDAICDPMSQHPNPFKRLIRRVGASLKMSVCPS